MLDVTVKGRQVDQVANSLNVTMIKSRVTLPEAFISRKTEGASLYFKSNVKCGNNISCRRVVFKRGLLTHFGIYLH